MLYKFTFDDEEVYNVINQTFIDRLKGLFGDGEPSERLLSLLQELDSIVNKVSDKALDQVPIPKEYEQEVIDKSEDIRIKRIALAKKLAKKPIEEYSRTENNQILRYLGLPMVSGVSLSTMTDMIPEIYKDFDILKGKEFAWDGIGRDTERYEEDMDYRQDYDNKYTRKGEGLFGAEESIRGCNSYGFDGLEDIRIQIHDYINNNDILVSALPCDLQCKSCPEQRIRLCWFHNQQQIEGV